MDLGRRSSPSVTVCTFVGWALSTSWGGCSPALPPAGDTDGGVATDVAPDALVDARSEVGRLPDVAVSPTDPDGNATFDDAIPAMVEGGAVTGDIASGGDFDYVRVDAVAGQWIAIVQGGGTAILSPASLALFDAEMRPLVLPESTGTPNGCSGLPDLQRELVVYAEVTGPIFIEVGPGFATKFDAPLAWSVQVVDLSLSSASLIVSETVFRSITPEHQCVLGVLETPEDEDTLPLSIPVYQTLFQPLESSTQMEVLDAGGGVVTRGRGRALIDVPMASLRLSAPEGPSQRSYVVWPRTPFFQGLPPFFVESASNDTFETAEPLPARPDDPLGYPATFIAHLPPGDTDYLALDVVAPAQLELRCSSTLFGSGVLDPEVTVLDAEGSPLSSASMTAGGVPIRQRVEPGRYVLRLTASRFDAEVSSTAVVCSFELVS